jgi:hypothetical protein
MLAKVSRWIETWLHSCGTEPRKSLKARGCDIRGPGLTCTLLDEPRELLIA